MRPENLPDKIVWRELDQEQRNALLEWSKNECANLSGADLIEANLSRANLSGANLSWATLSWANLSRANLRRANLSGANLSGANLSWDNLSGANLSGADLSGADLSGADLSRANLSRANLSGANLSWANLSGANLSGAKNIPEYFLAVSSIIADGTIVVWKKLCFDCIAQLEIPSDAQRSNATGRKCRASKARVLAIYDENGDAVSEGVSMYDRAFVYRVGETVEPREPFDPDRWVECGSGIHFFLTRYEAEQWAG